jgi:hypothetical protein
MNRVENAIHGVASVSSRGSRVFGAPGSFSPRAVAWIFPGGWASFLVTDALVRDQPDQPTLSMDNRPDSLRMSETRDKAAIPRGFRGPQAPRDTLFKRKGRETELALAYQLRLTIRVPEPGISSNKRGFCCSHHSRSATHLAPKITYDAGRFHVRNAHWHPARSARFVCYRAPKQYLNPLRRNTD